MFHPNIAMLGDQMSELCEQLKLAFLTENDEWFSKRQITIYDRGSFNILNKGKERNHWNQLCNGTVFKKCGKPNCSKEDMHFALVSMPVVSVPKLSAPGFPPINYENVDLVEKLGGVATNVFFPFSYPDKFNIVHTTTGISTIEADFAEDTPLFKVRNDIGKLKFNQSDKGISYGFQALEDGIYLVSGRDMSNLFEHSEEELDLIAKRLEAKRPLKFKCSGWKSIKDVVESHSEVFIIRDRRSGDRANLYLELNRPKRLASCKYKRLIPEWANDNQRQVIAQIPETKEKFIEIDIAAAKVKSRLRNLAFNWVELNLKDKSLSDSLQRSKIVPSWGRKIITRMLKYHPERWDDLMTEWLKKMPSKQLMDVLEVKD